MIRLLIVDDIASTRDNLRKLLGFEEDIEVIGTAGDGKQGLEEAHRLLPDIVLTDVNMPIMDGIQLTERLAQELPASPVIIMSVQGERDYLRRAMQAAAPCRAQFVVQRYPDQVVRELVVSFSCLLDDMRGDAFVQSVQQAVIAEAPSDVLQQVERKIPADHRGEALPNVLLSNTFTHKRP